MSKSKYCRDAAFAFSIRNDGVRFSPVILIRMNINKHYRKWLSLCTFDKAALVPQSLHAKSCACPKTALPSCVYLFLNRMMLNLLVPEKQKEERKKN